MTITQSTYNGYPIWTIIVGWFQVEKGSTLLDWNHGPERDWRKWPTWKVFRITSDRIGLRSHYIWGRRIWIYTQFRAWHYDLIMDRRRNKVPAV